MKFENISRRHFLQMAGASIVAINTPALAGRNKPRKPNIIFFIADDMFPDMFNCLPQGKGKNLTPNIDFLASEGTLMLGQHVVSPVCTPSRYNCLTGRYASRATNHEFTSFTKKNEGMTSVRFNSFITPKDVTLPKMLKKAGYATGMVGKNHVVEVNGFYNFPDYHSDPKDPKIVSKLKQNSNKIKAAIKKCGFDYTASVYHNNPHFIGLHELAVQNMDWIAKGGLDFIDQKKDEPFFLYLATTIPHGPTDKAHSWNADPLITADGFLDKPLDVLPPRNTLPERLEKAGLGGKDKENVLWLDDALGALIQKLKQHDILDDTIIFFFTDHGQNAKGTLYQGGVYDPSIVWRKGGFKCGSKSDALISNVDFAPTILDFANVKYKKDMFDGKSFVDVLDGKTKKGHDSLYFELGYARGVKKGDFKYMAIRYPDYADKLTDEDKKAILKKYNDNRRRMGMVMVTQDHTEPFSHFSMIPGGEHAEARSTGRCHGYYDPDQLYDLANDPQEKTNLANKPEYAKKLSEMKKLLQGYLDKLPGKFDL